MPSFIFHPCASVPPEVVQTNFDADMLSTKDASRILMQNTGCALSEGAESARKERRLAANVLPFRDKKDSS